jgi:alpha-beta hydrolase superfamily lysophospholipase
VVLSAHSTGGLTVPLWVRDHDVPAAGIVLNSPWLAMQGTLPTRLLAMPLIHRIGRRQPLREIPRTVEGFYGRSLHREHSGEWDFDPAWKPFESWPVYAGWIGAIREGHARVARGLDLEVPVLTLCSARSGRPCSADDPCLTTTDVVLDVEQIRRRTPMLSRHATVVQVDGAVHDVTLSAGPVRKRVYDEIGRWLSAYVES